MLSKYITTFLSERDDVWGKADRKIVEYIRVLLERDGFSFNSTLADVRKDAFRDSLISKFEDEYNRCIDKTYCLTNAISILNNRYLVEPEVYKSSYGKRLDCYISFNLWHIGKHDIELSFFLNLFITDKKRLENNISATLWLLSNGIAEAEFLSYLENLKDKEIKASRTKQVEGKQKEKLQFVMLHKDYNIFLENIQDFRNSLVNKGMVNREATLSSFKSVFHHPMSSIKSKGVDSPIVWLKPTSYLRHLIKYLLENGCIKYDRNHWQVVISSFRNSDNAQFNLDDFRKGHPPANNAQDILNKIGHILCQQIDVQPKHLM